MNITPLIKHNPECRKLKAETKVCQVAGCKQQLPVNVFNTKTKVCQSHKIQIQQRRGELRFAMTKMYDELKSYFAHFVQKPDRFLYYFKNENIVFSICSEFEFCYHWFVYTCWNDIESCLSIDGVYDLPSCHIFDLICTAVQRDLIKNIKAGRLVRVKVVPETSKVYVPK
jgi:hypothetical protein